MERGEASMMTLKRGEGEVFFGEGAPPFFSASMSDNPRASSASSESSPDSVPESSAPDAIPSAPSSPSVLPALPFPCGASRSENPSSRSSSSSVVFFPDCEERLLLAKKGPAEGKGRVKRALPSGKLPAAKGEHPPWSAPFPAELIELAGLAQHLLKPTMRPWLLTKIKPH